MKVLGNSLKVFWNSRNKLGPFRQTRMHGHSTSEGLCPLPSAHFPADTASPVASRGTRFISYAHYHGPSGEAGLLHASSETFLLLLLSTSPASQDPLGPTPGSHLHSYSHLLPAIPETSFLSCTFLLPQVEFENSQFPTQSLRLGILDFKFLSFF